MGRKSCCEPFQQFIAGCFQKAKVLNKCSQYATWYPFFYISSQKKKKKKTSNICKQIHMYLGNDEAVIAVMFSP